MDNFYFVTCFFDFYDCVDRQQNFKKFYESLSERTENVFVIESVLPGTRPKLNLPRNYFVVESDAILWQKENLLNLLIGKLPDNCHYVSWVDCDIIFENRHLIEDAKKKLENYKMIQMFSRIARLGPRGAVIKCNSSYGNARMRALPFDKSPAHGSCTGFGLQSPGIAWAIKKETLNELGGLFEYSIHGNGDSVMALFGMGWYDCVYKRNPSIPYYQHCFEESKKWHKIIQGQIGAIPGLAKHLWHGPIEGRKWHQREQWVQNFQFNPFTDLEKKDGLLIWKGNPSLQKKIQRLIEDFETNR